MVHGDQAGQTEKIIFVHKHRLFPDVLIQPALGITQPGLKTIQLTCLQ